MPDDEPGAEHSSDDADRVRPSPQNRELASLLDRVARYRDEQAFELLYRYLSPRLFAYMISIGTTSDVADDLVQETLTEVWRKAPLYQPERAAVSTWVFAIGRNARVNRFRKARQFEIARAQHPLTESEPAEQIDYDRQLDALDLLDKMQRLPEEQWQILRLSYIEGLSQSEISRRLNLPLGTVKSRVRLAFARIRQEMASS